jgi:predicted amidohydrolase
VSLVDFSSHLEKADSLLNLAQRLGSVCLEEAGELGRMLHDERTKAELGRLEAWVAQIPRETWEEVIDDPSRFEERAGAKLIAALKRAKTRQPLDFLGVLRGLCRKPLPEYYLTVEEQIDLDEGLPIPFATRPVYEKFGGDCTPSQVTLNRGSLLEPLPYSLFKFSARDQVRVVLDYGHRDRIDELGWSEERGLPRIATIHPDGGGSLRVEIDSDGAHFFDVSPESWDADAVLALLARAREEGADIAVLPELSLPDPGSLQKGLEASPESYPPLVVAGSAHCSTGTAAGDEIRSNESRVYLDGKCVAIAHKHHPFVTKDLLGTPYPEGISEDLTGEQKTIMVLSGSRTRIAVVICADLNDLQIPQLLVAAGVNLLLVPAMTEKIGSFNAPLSAIAGYCQGVCAIANTRWGEDGKPFLCMVSVPREDPSQQSVALPAKDSVASQLAIFDPNERLPGAVGWR